MRWHALRAATCFALISAHIICIPLQAMAQPQALPLRPLGDELTSSGQWRSATDTALARSYALQSPYMNLPEVAGETSQGASVVRHEVSPVVGNPLQLSLLLTGRPSGPDLTDHMARYMQVVPGLPSRFSDPKFAEVRAAFASCERSARDYRDLGFRLVGSAQFSGDLRSVDTVNNVGAYERDCLTALDSVPGPVRAVTGVLVTPRGAPWCSATIVGRDRLLTARHCFVDPATGEPYDTFQQMGGGRIGFRSIEPHAGHQSFSAAWLPGRVPPIGRFGPLEDFVVLAVTDWPFEHWAPTASHTPTNAELPISAWIVGSNATIGDVARAGSPLEFTRGSSPKACSLLEITGSGCFYHSCQTGAATSGAGVLTLSQAGEVSLLGVHNAAIAGAVACEPEPPLDDKLNLAIRIAPVDVE